VKYNKGNVVPSFYFYGLTLCVCVCVCVGVWVCGWVGACVRVCVLLPMLCVIRYILYIYVCDWKYISRVPKFDTFGINKLWIIVVVLVFVSLYCNQIIKLFIYVYSYLFELLICKIFICFLFSLALTSLPWF